MLVKRTSEQYQKLTEIIDLFQKNFTELYLKMKNTVHAYDLEGKYECSKWHLEDSIWTHTVLVINNLPSWDNTSLIIATLLHDVAKIKKRKVKEGFSKMVFYNHETDFSLALPVIEFYRNYYKDIDITGILYAINQHMHCHNEVKNEEGRFAIGFLNKIMKNYIAPLCYADCVGRIANDINPTESYNLYLKRINYCNEIKENILNKEDVFVDLYYFETENPNDNHVDMVKISEYIKKNDINNYENRPYFITLYDMSKKYRKCVTSALKQKEIKTKFSIFLTVENSTNVTLPLCDEADIVEIHIDGEDD